MSSINVILFVINKYLIGHYSGPAGAGNPLNPIRDGDRGLQLVPMNEEFPVCGSGGAG